MSTSKSSRSSIGRRAVAVVVLAVAAWLLFKLVIGLAIAVATTIAIVVAVLAIIWAYFTLRRS